MIEDSTPAWVAGQLALVLLGVDPAGLGGLHLRARAGPVRDQFLDTIETFLGPCRKLHPSISDLQLFGGVDLAETLVQGRMVTAKGLIATQQGLILTMAERCTPELAARLGQVVDKGQSRAMVLLDEGAEPEETAPRGLTERMAFYVDLDGLRLPGMADIVISADDVVQARDRLSLVEVPDQAITTLTIAALQFGIESLRAPLFALACARAHAALNGGKCVTSDDITLAAQLVYTHRATRLPQEDAPETESEPPEHSDPQTSTPDDGADAIPQEMVIEAVKALLPPDMLRTLTEGAARKGAKGSGGAGQRKRGNRRGRPLPSRSGRLDQGRIDIIATLRAAVPWQKLRRQVQPDRQGLLIRPSDIHIRQFQELSDRLVIFAVDASGSSAVARLAEAKGAVELMLGEAYARRDHVALVVFRGDSAEVVLPPTRSLVQTKRRLAGLPGGGGTPLASGLKCAAELARHAAGQGLSPSLAVLTDGRANVPLPGRTGRKAAAEDAQTMARHWSGMAFPSVIVDTGNRPTRDLASLAALMGGAYVPLPRADAQRLSTAIDRALDA